MSDNDDKDYLKVYNFNNELYVKLDSYINATKVIAQLEEALDKYKYLTN